MMVSRKSARCALAALAGAALLTLSAGAASAFPLAGPSLEQPAAAPVEKIWWDAWGRWHPDRRYTPPPFGFYGGGDPGWDGPPPDEWRWRHHHRRCWRGPWGELHCRY